MSNETIRFEADERPPTLLALGIGAQFTTLAIATVVLPPVILVSLGGGSEAYLSWAVFAAVIVSGIATIVQSVRVGRIGAGYILVMGSTSAFLPVSVSALEASGARIAGDADRHVVAGAVWPRLENGGVAAGVHTYRCGHRPPADSRQPGADHSAKG